jgi:hypothetical protein
MSREDANMDQAMERLSKLAAIEAICDENREQIKNLTKFILGNGKKGIFQRLDDLESFQQNLQKMEEKREIEEKERAKSFRNLRLSIYLMVLSWFFTIGYDYLKTDDRPVTDKQNTAIEKVINDKFDELLKKLQQSNENK